MHIQIQEKAVDIMALFCPHQITGDANSNLYIWRYVYVTVWDQKILARPLTRPRATEKFSIVLILWT